MKKFGIEVKWGIIFTFTMIAWMVMEKLLGWHDEKIGKHMILTSLFAIPAITIYILALRDKRDNFYSGRISWLSAFASGVIISVIIAFISPLTQYITLTFISPEYLKNAIDYAVKNQLKTEYQAENFYTLGNYIIQGILGGLALGSVTSAVIALFIRKK